MKRFESEIDQKEKQKEHSNRQRLNPQVSCKCFYTQKFRSEICFPAASADKLGTLSKSFNFEYLRDRKSGQSYKEPSFESARLDV